MAKQHLPVTPVRRGLRFLAGVIGVGPAVLAYGLVVGASGSRVLAVLAAIGGWFVVVDGLLFVERLIFGRQEGAPQQERSNLAGQVSVAGRVAAAIVWAIVIALTVASLIWLYTETKLGNGTKFGIAAGIVLLTICAANRAYKYYISPGRAGS